MAKKFYRKVIKLLLEFGKLLELKKINKNNKDHTDARKK